MKGHGSIKVFLLMAIFVFGLNDISSQVLKERNIWIVDIFHNQISSTNYKIHPTWIKVEGDTIINGIEYKMVLSEYEEVCGVWQKTNYLREKGDSLIQFDEFVNREFLLFDFGSNGTYNFEFYSQAGAFAVETAMLEHDSIGLFRAFDGTELESHFVRIISEHEGEFQHVVHKDIGFLDRESLFPYLGTGLCDPAPWNADIHGTIRCFISEGDTIQFKEYACDEVVIISDTVEEEFGSIDIYPNPASGYFYLDNNSGKSIESIHVFDLAGRLVNNITWDNERQIVIPSISSGLYILRLVFNDGAIITKKIVLERK